MTLAVSFMGYIILQRTINILKRRRCAFPPPAKAGGIHARSYDWYYGSPQTHGKPTTKSESVSDLVVCLPLGHYLYAECKVGNDCLTPRQTAFKLKIEKHGGWYITFSTAEELLPQVKKFLGVVQYTHKAHTHNKPIHA